MQDLPSLYWLHENPYSARFIAASSKCTTKLLPRLLTSCHSPTAHYCNRLYRNTGVNCFGVIHNKILLKTNAISKAKHWSYNFFNAIYKYTTRLFTYVIDEAYKVCGASISYNTSLSALAGIHA